MELDTNLDDEISEKDLEMIELALNNLENELTGPAGPFPLPTPPPSEDRMQSILQRAKLEAIAHEAADFARDGVAPGVKGVIDTLLALGAKPDENKPKDEASDVDPVDGENDSS